MTYLVKKMLSIQSPLKVTRINIKVVTSVPKLQTIPKVKKD
jgi:hypothetical protein